MQYKTLLAGSLFSGAAFAATGALGDAEPILDNPTDIGYLATFLGDSAVEGTVVGRAPSSGKGVEFTIELKITPGAGQAGAYGYHIHDAPVPASGDCADTLAHLDPYQRGADTPCDPLAPETCEVGDLAGKHGKIGVANSTAPVSFTASYVDLYASTQEGIGAFFGNRSIVVHSNDKSRIACANFIPIYGNGDYEDQVSTKPCSTGLVTKTLASTVTDGYATETISYETVETSTAYTVVPVSSAPVYSSTPCATSLITKVSESSTYVETSISYSAIPLPSGVPVPSGSVPSGNAPYPVSSGVPVPSGNGTEPVVPSGTAGSPSDVPVQTPVAPSTAPPAATNENEVPGSAATFGISASLAVAAIFAGFATIW